MTSKNKKNIAVDKTGVKGFFRLNIINPDGSVGGDTGWKQNQIVNNGYMYFLQYALASTANALRPNWAAIGSGTLAGAGDTTLNGQLTEIAARCALTTGTSGSKIVQYTFTLNSGTVNENNTISNVGLYYYSSSTQANTNGTFMAGQTFATSSLATNQAVNGTYQIIFG
jgi:hypothetical protein